MNSKIIHCEPSDIEKTSFGIIEKELKERNIVLDEESAPVIKRVIHTTADFDYVESMLFSENAIEIFSKILKSHPLIVTDTNMAKSGINAGALRKLGLQAVCYMSDEDIIAEAKRTSVTRASLSIKKAAESGKDTIYVIGNAPTALIELRRLIDEGYAPAFIIGVPVGFVNVVEAKELIMETDIPFIINKGRKGGSNVAAAIVNALLYMNGGR